MTEEQIGKVREHFCSIVDLNNAEAMRSFLKGHFRYHTMNSWNRSTGYAHCIKLQHLPIPKELGDAAYEMLESKEWWENCSRLQSDFAEEHDHRWQTGFNGRSDGYIVLYQGGRREDGQPFTWPGKLLDQGEDFEDWELSDLQERVRIVQEFDTFCANLCLEFLDYCERYEVVDEVIHVPKTIKVLKEKQCGSLPLPS